MQPPARQHLPLTVLADRITSGQLHMHFLSPDSYIIGEIAKSDVADVRPLGDALRSAPPKYLADTLSTIYDTPFELSVPPGQFIIIDSLHTISTKVLKKIDECGSCADYQMSPIAGLPPLWTAVITRRHSPLFRQLIVDVTQRAPRMRERSMNLTRQCMEHFFADDDDAPTATVGCRSLSLSSLSGLFVIYVLGATVAAVAVIVEKVAVLTRKQDDDPSPSSEEQEAIEVTLQFENAQTMHDCLSVLSPWREYCCDRVFDSCRRPKMK